MTISVLLDSFLSSRSRFSNFREHLSLSSNNTDILRQGANRVRKVLQSEWHSCRKGHVCQYAPIRADHGSSQAKPRVMCREGRLLSLDCQDQTHRHGQDVSYFRKENTLFLTLKSIKLVALKDSFKLLT
jgi:hypothetical protein